MSVLHSDPRTTAHDPDTRALLIGVDDYERFDPARSLAGSVQDLVEWRRVVERLGVPGGAIEVLASPAPGRAGPEGSTAATGAAIVDAFERLAAWLSTPGTRTRRALVFFAGHGDVDLDDPERLYLCPTDTLPGPVGRVELRSLLSLLPTAPDYSLTLVLECCFAGRAQAAVRALRPEVTVTVAMPALPPQVAILTAGDGVCFEYPLLGQWRGAFTFAVATVLDRWSTATDESGTFYPISHDDLARTAGDLLASLRVPQRPSSHPRELGGQALFQSLSAARRPMVVEPPPAGHALELTGATNGIRQYEIKVGGVLCGNVYVTGATGVPAGLTANTEYWDVAATSIANQTFTLGLVAPSIPALPAPQFGVQWRTLPPTEGYGNGTMPGGASAWTGPDGAYPWLRIDVTGTSTRWVRTSTTPLTCSPPITFVPSPSNRNFTGKYTTDEDWGNWP